MRITLLLTFFLLVISCGSGNETTSATTDEQNYFTLSEKTGYSLTELLDDFEFNFPFIVRFFLENMYLKFDNIRRQCFLFRDIGNQ